MKKIQITELPTVEESLLEPVTSHKVEIVDVTENNSEGPTFSFKYLVNPSPPKRSAKPAEMPLLDKSTTATFKHIFTPEIQEVLSKWDLTRHSQLHQFRYSSNNSNFKPYLISTFLHQLFRSAEFLQNVAAIDDRGGRRRLNLQDLSKEELEECFLKKLSTTVVNMEIFDRLYDTGFVNMHTDSIYKTYDLYLQNYGLTLSDKLRIMFLLSEAENNIGLMNDIESSYDIGAIPLDVFTAEEKNELIYHIMRRLVIGGAMNQYEDEFKEYIETTKHLYKDFVSVQKNNTTGKPEVASYAYEIVAKKRCKGTNLMDALFPNDDLDSENHLVNFCYVVVNPIQHTVTIWYNRFISVL